MCVVTSLPGRTGLGFMVAEKGLSVRCDQSPRKNGFGVHGDDELMLNVLRCQLTY